ncbi:MAG: orotate phosphoribosyltransferase [Methanoculleaceae archaeon]
MVTHMASDIARALRERGAIEYGNFQLASGQESNWYVDIKTAMTDPDLLWMVARTIAGQSGFDVVAGVAVGAVPLAVAVSLTSRKPYAIIRRAEKGYGKSGTLIGDVSGRRVLLVEDVVTTGGSVLSGVEVLRQADATVRDVVCVVDREQGGEALLEKAGIRLHSLVRLSELLDKGSPAGQEL